MRSSIGSGVRSDVLLRVDVLAGDPTGRAVLRVECDPLSSKAGPERLVAMLAEVRDDVTLLFGQMRVIGVAALEHRLPPGIGTGFEPGGCSDRVADLVVVADGVVGFLGRLVAAFLEQDRVKDLLLGASVDFQQVGKRLPGGGERACATGVAQVPQLHEPAAEIPMLVEDKVGDVGLGPDLVVSHTDQSGAYRAIALPGRSAWHQSVHLPGGWPDSSARCPGRARVGYSVVVAFRGLHHFPVRSFRRTRWTASSVTPRAFALARRGTVGRH